MHLCKVQWSNKLMHLLIVFYFLSNYLLDMFRTTSAHHQEFSLLYIQPPVICNGWIFLVLEFVQRNDFLALENYTCVTSLNWRYNKIEEVVLGVYSGWGYNLIYLIKNKIVYDCVCVCVCIYIYIYIYIYIVFYHPINWSYFRTVGTVSSLQNFLHKKCYKQ
jgi:hypothetical protein